MPDETERPVAFASRTLSPAECNYAQGEKEALSLIFGIRKFHQYLYGHTFTLVTDHKPLTTILGSKKGIPALSAAWMLCCSPHTIMTSVFAQPRHMEMLMGCHAFQCERTSPVHLTMLWCSTLLSWMHFLCVLPS